tara:strand:- start:41 stop:298 length:258 start_codon:yes stop_codon:yes gene_type:complete
MQYVYFKELPVGTLFSLNGTRFSKRSTKTAALVEFNRWFYFRQKDLCVVGKYSRLAADYFTENDLVTNPELILDPRKPSFIRRIK